MLASLTLEWKHFVPHREWTKIPDNNTRVHLLLSDNMSCCQLLANIPRQSTGKILTTWGEKNFHLANSNFLQRNLFINTTNFYVHLNVKEAIQAKVFPTTLVFLEPHFFMRPNFRPVGNTVTT
jgi:hypothetical protein